MKKAIALVSAAQVMISLMSPVLAGDLYEYDIVGPYLRRSDSIAAGAGNSSAVNTVTHFIDPWPRYVSKRRMLSNGERMSGAVERYRDVRKLPEAPAPISHPSLGQIGASTSATGSSSTSTK